MKKRRSVNKSYPATSTLEGAGVRLHRAFGFYQIPSFDPFLLMDEFRSDDPDDYLPGFPSHPHRGIEMVTYLIEGQIEQEDSMGRKGLLKSGMAQWITAGSGIVHSEMPAQKSGILHGIQLWINLPSQKKMTVPGYQEIKVESIPVVERKPGVKVLVICGSIDGKRGPVREVYSDIEFFDIALEPHASFELDLHEALTAFAYIIDGSAEFEDNGGMKGIQEVVLWKQGITSGECVRVDAGPDGCRFLFLSGQALGEKIVWKGPIVMNTDEEIKTAYEQLREGKFAQ